jgi:hypothetical protein
VSVRRWTVQVISAIEALEEDGSRMTLPPGSYVLRQLDLTHYELSIDNVRARIHLADVLGYVQDGTLRIPSGWP